MIKKHYIKPEIEKIELDNIISLMMASSPENPIRKSAENKSNSQSEPFASPFGDKPFK